MAHRTLAFIAAGLLAATPALAGPADGALPTHVGQCVQTRIKAVETRLVDGDTPIPDSGSAVEFANGGYQVSYDVIPAIQRSHRGDPVRMCLVSFPRHCPPGDDRGRIYRTTNLRTGRSWKLPDAEHMCGGA